MGFVVKMTNRASKGIQKLPSRCRDALARLLCDIRDFGPIQPNYSHFSRIGDSCFHCHLGFRWVACWKQEDEYIEVYYVGSRESAPY